MSSDPSFSDPSGFEPPHNGSDSGFEPSPSGSELSSKGECRKSFLAFSVAFACMFGGAFAFAALGTKTPADSPVSTESDKSSAGISVREPKDDDGTNNRTRLTRMEAVFERLEMVTDKSTLMTTGAPQNMAFEWLVNHDQRQVDPEHPNFIQRYALATLFFATTGSAWMDTTANASIVEDTTWMTSLHECEWDFVTCKEEVGLLLQKLSHHSHSNMDGDTVDGAYDTPSLNSSVVNEDNLSPRNIVGLNLEARNLMGEIPLEIGILDSLETLHLGSNELVGELPVTFGSLSQLEILRLGKNHFHGSIPSSFEELTNLGVLELNDNLFSGEIPAFLGNLTKLVELQLGNNKFSGSVPFEVCSMEAFDSSFVKPLPNVTCSCCTMNVANTTVVTIDDNSSEFSMMRVDEADNGEEAVSNTTTPAPSQPSSTESSAVKGTIRGVRF